MSTILHAAVIESLKSAREAFYNGRVKEYQEQLEAAGAGIDAIRSLGEPMDGSTGRPIEVLALKGEYALQAALPLLHRPELLLEQYEFAELALVSLFKSQVVGPGVPWLASPASLCAFYGTDPATLPALDKAALLYGKLTGGGGGGVTELYRAELAQLRGEREQAAHWARSAIGRITGDQWVAPRAKEILKQINEEEKA